MILNTSPTNEAVISNVAQVNTFAIKATAKSFQILSGSLYANKIRAIIRELSTNALDSHVAAGNVNTPFDVHLPNQLEPWFSVRDFGTGLSHDEVTNIYTTYFESTKTDSNDYVGALGLGSKSPFGYTDNFTVTAIKNGRKGIYTAYINEHGVPSIALMMEEETDEPAGVEVKFSVNDFYDYNRFASEARYVYMYFKHRPVISGQYDFKFSDPVYVDKDIIPGVHTTSLGRSQSIAVMGNIAYPIEIPSSDQTLEKYYRLLRCGLVLNFEIGELEFQPSREGLSYIPKTINAIKSKLDALNAVLATHIANEANKITNLWDRAIFLNTKKDSALWHDAIIKYVSDTQFPLMSAGIYLSLSPPLIDLDNLEAQYNLSVRAFFYRGNQVAVTAKPETVSHYNKITGQFEYSSKMRFEVNPNTWFVFNDTKVGAFERAKYHWKNDSQVSRTSSNVYVFDAVDKTKPTKFDEFLKSIHNPPNNRVVVVSSLKQKEKASKASGQSVNILRLETRGYGSYHAYDDLVWRAATGTLDKSMTYYYLPLSGYYFTSEHGFTGTVKSLKEHLSDCGIPALSKISWIYGVRKGDLEYIKTQPNWVNLETHIATTLANMNVNDLTLMVVNSLYLITFMKYNSTIVSKIKNANSPYVKLVTQFKEKTKVTHIVSDSLNALLRTYVPSIKVNTATIAEKFDEEIKTVSERYPLLERLAEYTPPEHVAEYINLVDASLAST